jgi:hypothetical protein
VDSAAVSLSDDLRDELDERPFIDPRTIPTRYSLLKHMALSPAHYLEACQQPQDDSLASRLGSFATDKKEALRFGSGVHLFLLGDDAKVYRFSGRRAGKAWEAAQLEAAEKGCVVILNDKEYVHAQAVAAAVRGNATAMRLLFDGTDVEKRLDWSWMGKACRSTPDARCARWIADLKTAQTAQPEMFMRHGARFYYHAQAAFYVQALEGLGLPIPEDCYVIAVEKPRPHPVTVLRFTADTLELGARSVRLWFERLLQCEAANSWPEYAPHPAIVDFAIEPKGEPFSIEIDGEKVEV